MSTVLIVDDDQDIRDNYKKMFNENGINYFEAAEALTVSEILMRNKSDIDLVVLDLQIAEVDGRDIYQIVHEYAPNIPVIVSSVLPIADQKLKISTARDYFNKKDDFSGLLKKVKTVLGIGEG